mmetsp:Transcript_3787/g.5627  ORF Transcript_3787/g.5627 Transcript_3787/m.5627 type:complete len:252 (-) Transcript_3787:927-1682(-)
MAASAARFSAAFLTASESTTEGCPASSLPSSTSSSVIMTPAVLFPLAWMVLSWARASVPSIPLVSARIRGTDSKASANFFMAYWSRPVVCCPNSRIFRARAISAAPPPATTRPSFHRALQHCTASSTALSWSLTAASVLALSTMVASLVSSPWSCSITITLRPPISRTSTLEQDPISSGVAAPSRTRAVALQVSHARRSSHFEGTLMAMMWYLVKKCMAISEMDPPQITTLHPESAICLMMSCMCASSPLL